MISTLKILKQEMLEMTLMIIGNIKHISAKTLLFSCDIYYTQLQNYMEQSKGLLNVLPQAKSVVTD